MAIERSNTTLTGAASKITPDSTVYNRTDASSIGRAKSAMLNSNSSLAFNTNTSDVKSLIMANAIYDKYDMDWFTKFNRFGVIDPYNALLTTKEYVFITKPDLCILDTSNTSMINSAIAGSAFFQDAVNRYLPVCKQLQSSASPNDGPFMNILSNSLTSSLDLPGISADTIETAANIMGTRITYRGTSHKSDEDFDFNLEFEDTKYLDVYMLFKMYDVYEKLKWDGAIDFTASSAERWKNYIINKVLHDQVSMYKIVVAEDGYRIVYWARITGCFPTSVPRDAFSDMTNSDPQKITVGWRGHFVRDMDPIILNEFNRLTAKKLASSTTELPLFNMETHAMDGRWAATPYIYGEVIDDTKHGKHREYYLRWKI